jgi:hypothetical protein
MPIRPYLEGRVFNPDRVHMMGIVFENVCRDLGLSGKDDLLAKVVARTVIDFATQHDTLDVHDLTAAVLEEFRRTK